MLQNAKSEKRVVKREKSDVKYLALHFSFFAFRDRFRIFCNKCIAGLSLCDAAMNNKICIKNFIFWNFLCCPTILKIFSSFRNQWFRRRCIRLWNVDHFYTNLYCQHKSKILLSFFGIWTVPDLPYVPLVSPKNFAAPDKKKKFVGNTEKYCCTTVWLQNHNYNLKELSVNFQNPNEGKGFELFFWKIFHPWVGSSRPTPKSSTTYKFDEYTYLLEKKKNWKLIDLSLRVL